MDCDNRPYISYIYIIYRTVEPQTRISQPGFWTVPSWVSKPFAPGGTSRSTLWLTYMQLATWRTIQRSSNQTWHWEPPKNWKVIGKSMYRGLSIAIFFQVVDIQSTPTSCSRSNWVMLITLGILLLFNSFQTGYFSWIHHRSGIDNRQCLKPPFSRSVPDCCDPCPLLLRTPNQTPVECNRSVQLLGP